MADEEIFYWSAIEQATAIRDRKVSPRELMEATLARIDAVNPRVNAFVTVLPERAIEAATESGEALLRGEVRGAVHGVPFTLKDVTLTAGIRTTFGSKAFRDHVPAESGPMYERLLAAGGVLLGKTATPEMAFKGVTDSPLTGTTNNPWDVTRTAGGSSGGAAAAVSSGMGALATGSDGGGSIRAPAACCGVVGLKPSLGRIPIIMEDYVFETTTQVGPITRTVRDAALMLDVLSGPDDRDPFSLDAASTSFLDGLENPSVKGLRVAASQTLGLGPIEPAVASAFRKAAAVFENLGAEVELVDWHLPDPVAIMRTIWPPVANLMLEDLLGRESRADVDQSILTMAEEGAPVTAAHFYQAGFAARHRLYQEFVSCFRGYDLLLTPTLPVVPFEHPPPGGQGPSRILDRLIWPYSGWLYFTAMFNFTGHPAITVPAGFSPEGVPIGLQVVGGLRRDREVLRAVAAYEEVMQWNQVHPRLE